jgi:hypothetical protein
MPYEVYDIIPTSKGNHKEPKETKPQKNKKVMNKLKNALLKIV